MSQPFDISKLTPLPNYVVNALNNPQRTWQGLPQTYQPQIIPTVTQSILSPLPILQIPTQPTVVQLILSPLPPQLGIIQLPNVPQPYPNIQPQPTIYIPTNGTKTKSYHQFTQELQLAPLSPRLPRIERKDPPTVVTHSVKVTKMEKCCICYDKDIPTKNRY